ncbi:MAG: ISNCY family transposase [Acidobacteria bacterium]|nr:MAG: ISNCY family transposase [Acidobacteriota bacterium]
MRDDIRQISFSDLELMRQGVEMDPALKQVSAYVDQHPELVQAVEQQLQQGLKDSKTGRRGLTGAQVLLSWILMRIKDWDYRELAERIRDGITLRLFTRFYSNPVPRHTAFHRGHNRLTPELIRRINEALLQAAVQDGLEDGEASRGDTTVVETHIHHPTDASLLWDTVRVVTRLLQQLRKLVPHQLPRYPKRTRAAKRRMYELQRMTASQREHQQVPKYRQLIGIAEETLKNARHAVEATQQSCGRTPTDILAIEALRKEITDFCQLGDRVVDQARRRVIDNEQVPAAEKIYSIFEPHTSLIKRGKAGKPVEFGHKIYLAETRSGLITQYWILDGNPSDEDHVVPSIQQHKKTFGRAPHLYTNDRGSYSADNIKACEQEGVACVSIPQRGGQKTAEREAFEKSSEFKQGQRFRAGIEGRISVLFRGRGMKRCLAAGRRGLELLVGVAVLANNLLRIAAILLEKL